MRMPSLPAWSCHVVSARRACFNLACLAALGAAAIMGWPQDLAAADSTRLVYVIGAVVIVGGFGWWRDWLCEQGIVLMIGLLGTIIGFWLALSGVLSGTEELKLQGLGTALSTTIVGLVGHFYLLITEKIGR